MGLAYQRLQVVYGGVAQLGEHLPCTQGVDGSSPFTSTIFDLEFKIEKIFDKACFIRSLFFDN